MVQPPELAATDDGGHRNGTEPLFSLSLRDLFVLTVGSAIYCLAWRLAPSAAVVSAAIMPCVGLMLIDYARDRRYLRAHRCVAAVAGAALMLAPCVAFILVALPLLALNDSNGWLYPNAPASAKRQQRPAPPPAPIPNLESNPPPRPKKRNFAPHAARRCHPGDLTSQALRRNHEVPRREPC